MNKKLTPIYTRFGDSGKTKTLDGKIVPKDCCLIEVNGDIDSLQTSLDKIGSFMNYNNLLTNEQDRIYQVQTLLWQLGGEISQQSIGGFVTRPINDSDVEDLENAIESFGLTISEFQRFKSMFAIEVNEARVRTRKLERTLTQYLNDMEIREVVYRYVNRLSDYFFALAVKIEQENLSEMK
ncbi:MAG: ATP:cob(I)alamin adenosyltransferase [archaeon]